MIWRKQTKKTTTTAELPPQKRRRARLLYGLGAAWMLLSYFGVELYTSCYLQPGGTVLTFGFLWAVLLTAVSLALPRWIGKVVYGLSFYLFAVFGACQCAYYAIFGRMMWLGDARYAGEGGAFLGDILGMFSRSWWFWTVALMVIGAIGCFLVPRGARPARLRWSCVLAGTAAAVGLYAYPQVLFRQDSDAWGYQAEYLRAQSLEGIYTSMYDAHQLYQFCGIYQTTMKDLWKHDLYALTPVYRHRVQTEARELDAWFEARPAHRSNEMTGVFQGKNVVLVLMESMDDWLINEKDTPTISRLMREGIQFTNFYTPGFGSVRTFNSEFCVNTGIFLPTNGQYAFDYCNNDFSQSMPAIFRSMGYSTQAFHYNDASFYNRGVMEPAMGYEAYNCYADFGISGDALLSDTCLFENPALMERFYGRGKGEDTPFFDFIISRNAHMTYAYDEQLSRWALEQYPYYRGSSGSEEVDCIRAKAHCCDDLFAALLDSLEENGHLEDTVIIAFTDHYAYGMKDQTLLQELSGVPAALLVEKTPCFIWSAGGPAVQEDKILNTSDLLPTVLNLFGVESDYHYLGQDAFDAQYPGYAIFQEWAWVMDKGAYENAKVVAAFDGEGPDSGEVYDMNVLTGQFIRMNNLFLESDYYGRRNAEQHK